MTRKKKLTNEEGLEDKVKKNLSKEEVEEISLKRYLEWWNKIRFDAMDLYLKRYTIPLLNYIQKYFLIHNHFIYYVNFYKL